MEQQLNGKIGDTLSFEQAMLKLEEIVKRLESGGIGLDEAVELYNEAASLRKYCEERLRTAELKIYSIDQKAGSDEFVEENLTD